MQSHINEVNLIGKIKNEPFISIIADGRKIGRFLLETRLKVLQRNGEMKEERTVHRIHVKGASVQVLEAFAHKGMNIALNGKIMSRFYRNKTGSLSSFSEIEVNDLVLL